MVCEVRLRATAGQLRDWVEAAGDYVRIHAGTKERLHRETMTEFEKRLGPHGFARIHRPVIVNADRITELR